MALLSFTQITNQLRNSLVNNAAVSTIIPNQKKAIVPDSNNNNDAIKDTVAHGQPEIVVYPRRVKAIDEVVVTLAKATTTNSTEKLDTDTTITGAHSGLNMPVTPHYLPPRAPIVLCHGLYGFDKIGPDSLPLLQVQYWGGIENALAKLGAKVIVTKVPSTGSILERAQTLHSILKSILEGKEVNFIAHSMGGLDCRYLISHIPDKPYKVNSLVTISTPHRGSAVMDWFRDNVGVGMAGAILANATQEALIKKGYNDHATEIESLHEKFKDPSSFAAENFIKQQKLRLSSTSDINKTSKRQKSWSILTEIAKKSPSFDPLLKKLIQLVDTAAYANLTTDYCNQYFNPNTPNDPNVSYYSYGANATFPSWSLLNLASQLVKDKEGVNDGIVSVKSAKWGKYMKTVEADHWDLNGQRYRWRHTRPFQDKNKFDTIDFYMEMATNLYQEGH